MYTVIELFITVLHWRFVTYINIYKDEYTFFLIRININLVTFE